MYVHIPMYILYVHTLKLSKFVYLLFINSLYSRYVSANTEGGTCPNMSVLTYFKMVSQCPSSNGA